MTCKIITYFAFFYKIFIIFNFNSVTYFVFIIKYNYFISSKS